MLNRKRKLNVAGKGRRTFGKRNLCPSLGRSHAGLRRLVVAVTTASALLAWTTRARAQGNASTEYEVKAAFLFHFAQFVDWPPEAFNGADSPITYCTVGLDPFRGALDSALNGKSVGARPLRVRHLMVPQRAQGCQVLFVGREKEKSVGEVLAAMQGSTTLTVGETEHFARDGGMVGFVLEDNKVRFEINLDAAAHAKLKISARLLALAKTVIGAPQGM